MNRILSIITFLTFECVLSAQTEIQDMNTIKSNPNYIYATGTSLVSNHDASQNAKDLLNAEIEDWLKKCAESDIAGYIAKSQEQLGLIKTRRGNLFRVFAYVHKADILPYHKDERVISGSFNDYTDDEAPNAGQSEIRISTDPDTEGRRTEDGHIADVPKTEQDPPVVEAQYVPDEQERELLTIKTFLGLNEYINTGRGNGSIVQLGKYSTLPKDGLVYVFIHNREGTIPACLKIDNGHTLNLETCKEDQITDYKGCGAIWIRFK